jgi:hypothetical protein
VPLDKAWIMLVLLVPILIPLWADFRIKKKKLGFAPFMIVLGWGQGIYMVIDTFSQSIDNDNSNPIGNMLVYFVVGILVARGWNAFEALNQIREGIVKKED